MELIDSHCHLNYDFSPKSTQDLIHEARQAGVHHLITIGTDLPSIPQVQKISEENDGVFHTIGVHPHEAGSLQESDLLILEKALSHPKCRAVGEIGLDYHYNHSSHADQIARLEDQLQLAIQTKKPVIIHSREAEKDLLDSLSRYRKKISEDQIPGVIHCFSGTYEFGAKCIEMGFYISFSGILTFKNAEDIRSSARNYPIEKLLVETDSPYLAPIPFRGKKCEPSMVKWTAQKLAEVKNIPLSDVAAITTHSAKKVFSIPLIM